MQKRSSKPRDLNKLAEAIVDQSAAAHEIASEGREARSQSGNKRSVTVRKSSTSRRAKS